MWCVCVRVDVRLIYHYDAWHGMAWCKRGHVKVYERVHSEGVYEREYERGCMREGVS